MKLWLTELWEGFWTVLVGMKITWRHMFRDKVTLQYPNEKWPRQFWKELATPPVRAPDSKLPWTIVSTVPIELPAVPAVFALSENRVSSRCLPDTVG